MAASDITPRKDALTLSEVVDDMISNDQQLNLIHQQPDLWRQLKL